MNTVIRRIYSEPAICEREILRYAGCKGENSDIQEIMRGLLNEVRGKLTYTACYREFPLEVSSAVCDLNFACIESKGLAKNLENCKSVVVFGATIGLELDRLIAKYSKISPSKAIMLQAIGAERVEALCDELCGELSAEKRKEGLFLKPRYSPGYGDLPLDFQRKLFSVLDCPRQIGLTLNDSMLMSPSKSVTAIIGITDKENIKETNKCSLCNKKDCNFRSL